MIRRVGSRGLRPVLNVAVLAIAFFALFTHANASIWYRLAAAGGGVFVCLVALLTFAERSRTRWLSSPSSPAARIFLAVAPWIAIVGLVGARGLWWTQRPAALRFFVLYAIANWSVGWCVQSGAPRRTATTDGSSRAVTVLAAGLGLAGLQGAAFGVTPFGCFVSAGMAAIASAGFAAACFGGRSARLKMFAASLATLLGVLSVEAAVRLLHIGHNVQEMDSREHARNFYTLTPPRSAFVNQPNTFDEFGPALIEINSLGIRGPELTDPHADLLLIGDSMIEARQLPWAQTLAPALEAALRKRGLSIRMVAHGMRGWSPLLEWNWYLKAGRRFQPKTVMLFFFWNDLWAAGDEVSTFSAELTPDGRPAHFDVPVDSNWIWYKHVRVVRLVGDVWHRLDAAGVRRAFTTLTAGRRVGALDDESAVRLARTLNERPLTENERDALLTRPESELDAPLRALARTSLWPGLRPLSVWTDSQRAAAAKTELELQRFGEDVSADGGRLVIVYVPNPMQVGAGECAVGRLFERIDTNVLLPPSSGIQTWLRGVADRHGLELLDPSRAMREFDQARPAGDTAPLYLRADCHWAERGHRFMAEYLADWCRRNMVGAD